MLSDQIILALITGLPAIIIAITGLIVVLKKQSAQATTIADIKATSDDQHAESINRISNLETAVGVQNPPVDKPKGT